MWQVDEFLHTRLHFDGGDWPRSRKHNVLAQIWCSGRDTSGVQAGWVVYERQMQHMYTNRVSAYQTTIRPVGFLHNKNNNEVEHWIINAGILVRQQQQSDAHAIQTTS